LHSECFLPGQLAQPHIKKGPLSEGLADAMALCPLTNKAAFALMAGALLFEMQTSMLAVFSCSDKIFDKPVEPENAVSLV